MKIYTLWKRETIACGFKCAVLTVQWFSTVWRGTNTKVINALWPIKTDTNSTCNFSPTVSWVLSFVQVRLHCTSLWNLTLCFPFLAFRLQVSFGRAFCVVHTLKSPSERYFRVFRGLHSSLAHVQSAASASFVPADRFPRSLPAV